MEHINLPFDPWGHDTTHASSLTHVDLTGTNTCDLFLDLFQLPTLPDFGWELPKIGGEPLVQTFFEGPQKCKCCINWVEKPPKEIPIESQDKYQQAAIRVYKRKDHHGHDANGPKPSVVGGLTTTITISYIEIQSPIIRQKISPIFAEGGLEILDTETIKIFRPFKELYFAHSKITDILKDQADDTKEKKHMQVLVDVMGEIFSEVMPEVSALHVEKKITYRYLWTLFPKGIIAYSHQDDEDQLYEVLSMNGDSVECRCLRSDGTTIGWHKTSISNSFFTGIRKISSLEVYPIGFHTDKGMETRLAKRGLRVLGYQDIVHCQYRKLSSSQFSSTAYVSNVFLTLSKYQTKKNSRREW
jgi:hypothetical protein